ncbi:MAG: DUF6751 family protein [Clostridium sp.]
MGVLFKNSDVTIYNKYYDKVKDCDMYQRTVLKGVNWQGKRNVTVGDKGLLTDDSVFIFIDKLNNYIGPKKFNMLSDQERINYFTFNPGDKVVKGECDFHYKGIKGATLKDLENNYDDVLDILGCTPWSNHFEVEGK